MTRLRESWEIAYELIVDGKETGVELIGGKKTEAYATLGEQWKLKFPDSPVPSRRRCKLQEIDRTFNGYG